MTNFAHDHDDLEVVDLQDAMETFVLHDTDERRRYLRARWIEEVMLQLVEHRVLNGLTQRELGERMGKPQSSIARLERSQDIKLSTLWDYLAAMGTVPSGRLPLTELATEDDRLSRYVVGTGDQSPVLRVQHWRKAPLEARAIDPVADDTVATMPVKASAPVPETDVVDDDGEKVAVA